LSITTIDRDHREEDIRRRTTGLVSGTTKEERFRMGVGSTRLMVDQCGSVKTR
jgi:hypothetical protein